MLVRQGSAAQFATLFRPRRPGELTKRGKRLIERRRCFSSGRLQLLSAVCAADEGFTKLSSATKPEDSSSAPRIVSEVRSGARSYRPPSTMDRSSFLVEP